MQRRSKIGSSKSVGLGRGLEGLIPKQAVSTVVGGEEPVRHVPIQDIKPNPDQPRKHFRPEALAELAQSIKEHGILQPIIVSEHNDGGYIIIAGERRWRAAKDVGHDKVPAIIRSIDLQRRMELALIENLQRDDLTILEIASAFAVLITQSNMSTEDLAKRVGRSISSVTNIVRLLGLPPDAKEALHEGKISEGHARQILAVREPAKQAELLQLIQKHGWSVRKAEQYAKASRDQGADSKQAIKSTVSENDLTKKWQKKTGQKVRLQRLAKEVRLVISAKDEQTLEKISKKILS